MALTYWEKRALQRMLDAQARADGALRVIGRAVQRALRELLTSMERISSRYETSFGLTPDEARAWLESPAEQEEYHRLLAEIATLPDGEAKRRLQARAASGAYAYRISQKEAMRAHVEAQAAALGVAVERETNAALLDAGAQSIGSTREDLVKAGLGYAFTGEVRDVVEEILHTPWNGSNYASRVWKNTEALQKLLDDTIMSGFLSGRSPKAIAAEVAERMDVAYYQAERLVRTEVSRLQNATALGEMQRAGIEEYEWLGTLDKRTCKACGAMDGQRFLVKDAKVSVNLPPLHPFCRCTIVPYLGARAAEATRFARDMQGNGIKVPAGMTHAEWVRWQQAGVPADVQAWRDAGSKTTPRGEQEFIKQQQMWRNEKRDRAQYQAYKDLLGRNYVTKSFEAFQQTKYNNPETYSLVKLDYKRQQALVKEPSLALPNANAATAADAKFTGYLFNPESADGWPKGVAFQHRLGYNGDNWEAMQREILRNAPRYPGIPKGDTQYGTRYEQRMVLYGTKNTPANVTVGWLADRDSTHMTSAYIKEVSAGDTED